MEVLGWPQKAGSRLLPWEPLKIMPIGDIQYAGPGGSCDLDKLARHIQWGVEQGCYFIGMGDYVDFPSPSNRRKLLEAGLYDTAEDVIDRAATMLEDELFDYALKPSVGRWIGMLEGHHWYPHLDGTTSDTRLARKLGATFLGNSAMIRLTFRKDHEGMNCVIWCHHGHGSGMTVGAGLNKLEKLSSYFGADIMLMGHYHRLSAAPIDRIEVTSRGTPHLYHKTRLLVQTGSWMKGWLEGGERGGRAQGGYPEKGMMAPLALGGALITVEPKTIRRGRDTKVNIPDLRVSL